MLDETQNISTTIQFTLEMPDSPEAIRREAERKAKEACIMTMLRYGEISSGRAGISRLEAIDLMGEYGISVFAPQTREELEQEVEETIAMLEKRKQ